MEQTIADIEERARYLLAERRCSNMNPQKFVDWAVYVLQNKVETENILILAGLDNYPREEIEAYFWKCVEDLQLKVKQSDFELLGNYAHYIANGVVTHKLAPGAGLIAMSHVVRESQYAPRYLQFYTLEEDIDCLTHVGQTVYNVFDKTADVDEVIREEFRLFLQAESLGLGDDVHDLVFCKRCEAVAKPVQKPKKNWLGTTKYYERVCSTCSSKNLTHFSDQQGKRIILAELARLKVGGKSQ